MPVLVRVSSMGLLSFLVGAFQSYFVLVFPKVGPVSDSLSSQSIPAGILKSTCKKGRVLPWVLGQVTIRKLHQRKPLEEAVSGPGFCFCRELH